MIRFIVVTLVCVVCIVPVMMQFTADGDNATGEVLDVLIIDGQSNAAYPLDIADPDVALEDYPDRPDTKLMYYGTVEHPAVYGSFDSSFASYSIYEMWGADGWIIGGYEPGLASTIADRNSRDVLIINVGVAGASVSELVPTATKGEYGKGIIEHALREIKDSGAYDSINMLGWMWCQGEADALMSVSDYIGYFTELDGYMDSIGADDCYIVMPRLRWGNSVAAQIDLIHSRDNVLLGTDVTLTFSVDNGTLLSDNVHYTQKGRDIIAADVGSVIDTDNGESHTPYLIIGIVPIVVVAALVIGAVTIIARRAELF